MKDLRLRKGQPMEGRIRYISKNPKLKDVNKKNVQIEEYAESSDGVTQQNELTLIPEIENRSEIHISSETGTAENSGPII
jgi:hypothetical protein